MFASTNLYPAAMLILLIGSLAMLLLPRRMCIIPFIVVGCIVPFSQLVVFAGLHFMLFRIMILFGWIRVIMRSEFDLKLEPIDKAILLFVLAMAVSYTLLWQTGDAFINKMGYAYSALGTYFLFRLYIKSLSDLEVVVKTLGILVIIISFCMIIERQTEHNPFYIFGGVPEMTIMREGKVRCQGPFAHPITVGSFAAAMLPLFYSFYRNGSGKKLFLPAMIASATMVFLTSSSGPAFSFIAVVGGLFFWRLRRYVKVLFWSMVCIVIVLHIVMRAPVWALIDRVSFSPGSHSYHRFLLVDQFINRFDEWWLFGTQSTAHWGHESVQLWDVSNQYVRTGVDGGLISLILFLVIIYMSFKAIVRNLRSCVRYQDCQCLFWGLGVALVGYLVSFLGVSIWDQTIVVWYMILALTAIQYDQPDPETGGPFVSL